MRPSLLRLALLPLCLAGLKPFASADIPQGMSSLAPLGPQPSIALLSQRWSASWIAPAAEVAKGYGVHLFRKSVELQHKPSRFVVHVSGEARFVLLVNGVPVARGPQLSDSWLSRYDSIDLAPWLREGRNVVAAMVWSYGDHTPLSLVGKGPALIVQGDDPAAELLNTDATWQVLRNEACTPLPVVLRDYYVAGPGLHLDGTKAPWGWETGGASDKPWAPATVQARGNPPAWGTGCERGLTPRTLPAMEEKSEHFQAVRSAEGVVVPPGFTEGKAPLVVPAHTKASLLLDHGTEINAFPQLSVSGGQGSLLRLTYAEALVDKDGNKGHRSQSEGRRCVGRSDEFLTDGGKRCFSPLEYRTYRYVQLDVSTGKEPLRIEQLRGLSTAYPFREIGRFSCEDPALAELWRVGWRTARLCAYETYMDCPYYEQLQYIGDTRIQALISLYVSGDDRLMRNAIELFDRSRIAEGLTLSRAPSASPQIIPPFSLYWVEMVHDYWMHRTDDAFVRQRLPGMQAVLAWFERHIDPKTGLLGPLPYWNFVDWTSAWSWDENLGKGGEPEAARLGGSAILSLQFAGTLRGAAQLFRAFGDPQSAARYEERANSLCLATKSLCWDATRGLFADSPERRQFSQHANALAVLAGAVEGAEAGELMRKTRSDPSLIQCSTYFRFYLLGAMTKAGLGEEYLRELGPWRQMLDQGLTTFAEQPEPTRSDCHAWSASPVYDLLATVAGVRPAAPGFSRVQIAPQPGHLPGFTAVVAHPRGLIEVQVTRTEMGGLKGVIILPEGIEGDLQWEGSSVPLRGGRQSFEVQGRKAATATSPGSR